MKIETQHWTCNVPTLLRDVDLDSAAVAAPVAQVVEVSLHGSVEAPPAIDAGQAPAMDNVIPVAQCTLITCAHAPPLASTSNQLLLTSASTAAPLLVRA